MPEAHDAVFAALGDPTRRRVLRQVAERGPTSATLLEDELPVTRPAIVGTADALSRERIRHYSGGPDTISALPAWPAAGSWIRCGQCKERRNRSTAPIK
jgi:hypothetical protein